VTTPELETPLELYESFLDLSSSQSSIENKVDSCTPVPITILPKFSSPTADNLTNVNSVTPDTIPILPNVSNPMIDNSNLHQPSNAQLHSQAQSGDNENEQEIDYDLKTYRVKNVGKIIMATLNINSIRNKFEQLKMLILVILMFWLSLKQNWMILFPLDNFSLKDFLCLLG